MPAAPASSAARTRRVCDAGVSGAAVAVHAPHPDNAVRLLEFLVSEEAQEIYAGANYEYPVREGVPADAFDPADLDRLDGLVEVRDGRALLTRRGRLLANEVSMHLR